MSQSDTAWSRFLQWFIPDRTPASQARQYRIVVAVVCTFLGVAAVFTPPCIWLGYTGSATGLSAAMVIGLVALYALRTSGPVLAAHLTAVACCAILLPYITLAGGFEYPFFFWFLIVPFCAGLLGGQRVGLIWSAIIAVVVLGYTALYLQGTRLPATEMVDPPAVFVLSQALALVFMCSATMFIFQQNVRWEAQQTRAAIQKLEVEVAERRAAEAAAQEANLAKSAFLAMMSHELRTPMNGVLGMAQLLLLEEQPGQQRRYTVALRDSGELLMSLLDSLLDFAKIEGGHVELERRAFSLSEVLESAGELMGGRAEQKQVAFVLALDPDLPSHVWGDELRLRQMVLNLLSNAIKFTDKGSVTLRARATADGTIVIEVDDTGIGIAPDVQDRLFEAFTQADSATTRKYGGTGLGLAIVSSLSEAMGGSVRVTSALGEGSRFTLELPLEPAPSMVEADSTGIQPASGLRVLVVEDNPVNRMVAAQFLSNLGCPVESADDGEQALAALETLQATDQTSIDLVLMDMHMPVMDGLDATRAIRARLGSQLPVIGLTASVTERDRAACMDAGMDDVLSKPLVLQELRALLERYSVPTS